MSTWKFLGIILSVVILFSAVYFPAEFTLIHGIVVTGSTILLGLLIMSVMSELKRLRVEKKLKQSVRQAYTKFAAERGELFDRSDVEMNAADRTQVKGRIRLLFILTLSSILFFSTIGYFAGSTANDLYLFLALIVLIIVFSGYMYFQYNRVLKCNFKTLVRGVLTDKRRLDDGDNVEYEFELSNKEWIPVRSSDYKRFTPGDIIEIQMLSGLNSLALKNEISLVGRMDLKAEQVKL